MKKVLVTGGTGFVGANLVRRLLIDGYEVHLLVRETHATWRIEEIRQDIRLHIVNLADGDAVQRVVSSIQPDWIFHLAVYGAYSSQQGIHQMIETNLVGTVNLVQAGMKSGVEAFVNTGSSSEYGFKEHAPKENEWLDPNSHYAITKASATHFCRYTAQTEEVFIPTLRLYSVYGAYEEPTRLLPTLIMQGLQGKLPALVSPEIARDYVYIDDVVDAYLLAVNNREQPFGAVYNVGTGVQTSLREVVAIARDVMEIPVEPEWGSMESRTWDTSVWIADNSYIHEQLGWQPRYNFEQGFHAMVDWMRATSLSVYK